MLCQCSSRSWNVEFIDQLIENLEAEYTMIDGRLEELGHIISQLAVDRIIKPTQLRNPADKFD
jgi:hypothetical protein